MNGDRFTEGLLSTLRVMDPKFAQFEELAHRIAIFIDADDEDEAIGNIKHMIRNLSDEELYAVDEILYHAHLDLYRQGDNEASLKVRQIWKGVCFGDWGSLIAHVFRNIRYKWNR